MEDQRSKFRKMVRKTQNMLEKTDLRSVADVFDMFQHICREWNQEADRLTHVERDKGVTWNSLVMELGALIEAVRSYSDGGMSSECNAQIKKQGWLSFCDSNC